MTKLAIAPINWTNDDLPELGGHIPFEQCIEEMALSGYNGCEIGNKFPRDPRLLKKALEPKNLQVCNQWFSYEFTSKPYETVEKDFLQLLNFLKKTGAKIIGGAEVGRNHHSNEKIGVLEEKITFSEEEWDKISDGLNKLGRIAREEGLTLAYHHHMGTGVQSLEETLELLSRTEPEYVSLNYDSGHFLFAGHDPLEALQKTRNRIAHVHLKDIRPEIVEKVRKEKLSFLEAVRQGAFTVPGDGCIDFKPIINLLKANRYDGWYVVEAEQDPEKAHPLTYARKARAYIKNELDL